ncbi:DUF2249 domain-containing protein [Mucilaginibacter boryungensis]|uniref:DUF2249 domain-containing protein n=1 Tax=Mucilaginibacter boryungensis TaxID=768480 RepID=A0ABR9XD82_9SPHI|nr:DUF2249 domain-containing protein [Mucilaginibacter boryungensis]MBE9665352.1 DUF2249 domain-containing protein [Mucilaginibacter boryungensis]
MQITIDANTKISQLLEVNRELVINTLVGLNQKFARLKNPILRGLFAKRVSVADACKISHTPLSDFLWSMEQIGFRVAKVTPTTVICSSVPAFAEPRDYLELDVRPILADGRDPLKEILAAVKLLEVEQGLKLINSFEPLPLIHLLAEKGFAHRVTSEAPDLVITCFNQVAAGPLTRLPVATEPVVDGELFDRTLAGFSPQNITYVDVRQLEMPKPMLTILERTSAIRVGKPLFVYHKKIPIYLLPELEKQGLAYLFKNIGPGDVHLLILRK